MVNGRVGACFSAANLAGQERIEGPLDVARGQELAIVEVNSMMEVKNVGLARQVFPNCQPAKAAG